MVLGNNSRTFSILIANCKPQIPDVVTPAITKMEQNIKLGLINLQSQTNLCMKLRRLKFDFINTYLSILIID